LARLTCRTLLLLPLLAALACGVPARAEPPLVLAFDELPPWKTQDGKAYRGAYTAIVRELARRAGVRLEIANCPLKRCLFMLEQGRADIVIGLKETPERQRYLHFLRTPYRDHSADKVFYVQKQKGTPIRSYADLAGLRIGVKLGAEYFERFDHDSTLAKAAVRDMEANFRKLALGRLDAVLIPEDQGEALVAQLGLQAQVAKAPYREADPSPRSVAITKRSPHAAHIEVFEQAMADMARDGTLAALFRREYYDAYHVPVDAVQIR
jgi:polar amino acid transport system substrate-binding protein